ncbi:ARM repeat-containing protein [Dentipellis sp. KUC8613]|nr:ARM repeat-containing protein [Dentipellis sp. KUC8613]
MGKSQKQRAMRRHNPMRVPDSHLPKGLASASSSSSKGAAILPIMQKMGGLDPLERKWACVAVSSLIQNDPSTRRLLQGKNIVGALITRLSDGEEEVVVEAAGALRNLCVDGGYDICAEMYNKHIIAPLQTFIPKISTTLSQFLESPKTAPENAQKVVYEFADNVITILWCLSETSNKALNAVNELSLVPFLMSFLISRDRLPITTVTSAAQCLYVLTDDNRPAIEEIRSNLSYAPALLEIARSTDLASDPKGKSPVVEERAVTLRVLGCGILRNVSPLPPPSAVALIDLEKEVLLPVLAPVASSVSLVEATDAVNSIIQRQAENPPVQRSPSKNGPKMDQKTPEEIELERIEARLRSVHLALEILTGVCATLPDVEEVEAEEDEEDDEDKDDDNMDDIDGDDTKMALDDVEPTPNGTAPSQSDLTPSSFLPTVLEPLLALIQPTTLSFPPPNEPSPHPPTTSALSAIHIAALECLNNAFLSLAANPPPAVSADVVAGRRVWDAVWRALGAAGMQGGAGQERRKEMWEVAVGVLWGIGRVWSGKIPPDVEQVNVLMRLIDEQADDALRVKCIGTLESLAQNPESIDTNKLISQYFIAQLPTTSAPSPLGTEPLLQVVSALIDIYSDEDKPYDVNFRQGQYLETLTLAVEGVRKAVKGIDKKREGGRDLWRHGGELRDNLVEFIKYRRALKL